MNEFEAIAIVCGLLNGDPEVRYEYEINEGSHYVQVDCATQTHVIEVGLDTRSSLDSAQQAKFAESLSGKKPASQPTLAAHRANTRFPSLDRFA